MVDVRSEPAHALLRAGFPYVETIGMIRISPGPVDVALGPDRLLYVLCRGRGVGIFVNTLDDEYPLSRLNIGGGKLVWPACVVLDAEDNLFISDEATHQVKVFDGNGELLGELGELGDGPGQFNRPSGIAFDPDQNLYVSDTLNHRVQKLTKDGEPLMSFGAHGDGPGEFDMPWGIHADDWGGVYVVDWRNDRVQKFTADGAYLFEIGGSGSGDGEFNRPSGVAVDADGDIYVADRENHRGPAVQPRGPVRGEVPGRLGDFDLRHQVPDEQPRSPAAAGVDQPGGAEAVQGAGVGARGSRRADVRARLRLEPGPGLPEASLPPGPGPDRGSHAVAQHVHPVAEGCSASS